MATLKIDSLGKAQFVASSLPEGNNTFVANYGGNTIYAPQSSNNVVVEVKKNETSLKKINKQQNIYIFPSSGNKYIKGTMPGDEVSVFNTSGQLISSFKATSNCQVLYGRGLVIIKIKSANKYIVLKGIL